MFLYSEEKVHDWVKKYSVMFLLPSAFSFDIFHQRCGIWSFVRSHVQYTQNLNTALKIGFCYAQVLWRVGCSCSVVTQCSWRNVIIQLSAVHVSSWSRMLFREIDLLSSEVKITLMGCIDVLFLITRPSASEDGICLRYCQAVWGQSYKNFLSSTNAQWTLCFELPKFTSYTSWSPCYLE